MGPKKIARDKKLYIQPELKRMYPPEALAKVQAAAQAGNKAARTMLDRMRSKRQTKPEETSVQIS